MKMRTRIQRKNKKKFPSPSSSVTQFQGRPFAAPASSPQQQEMPEVQREVESQKRGHNLANISVVPPEESQRSLPRLQPQLNRGQPMHRDAIQRQELDKEQETSPLESDVLQRQELDEFEEEDEITLLESDAIQALEEEELPSNQMPLQRQLSKSVISVAQLGDAPQEVIQRRGKGKDRHAPVDDRHNITDPYINPDRWLETLKRERVADLFRTPGGLDGHVKQIQGEINRLIGDRNKRKLEGQTGDEVMQYTTAIEQLRAALISSTKAATFDFAKIGIQFAPLGSDLYLERDGGKVKVDGRPVS